ncbi:MAG TPA: hypothetical protein VK988_13110 [Acidimicrobiales bacterium]|nr:hypothetical protein [Acidimicrobiales bacterium]
MAPHPEGPSLDVARILDALERHHVQFLVVGGTAAAAYGAVRPTDDFDCLPERSEDNLGRLSAAMRELNARLRVEGLTDVEAQQLPTHIDAVSLGQMELSTWRTDAGPFDVLADLPNRDGQHLRYEDLLPRAVTIALHDLHVRVAALDDLISSKEWADRPKDHEALPELHALHTRHGQDQGTRPQRSSGDLSAIAFPQPPPSTPPATRPGASAPPNAPEPPRGRHR